MFCLVYCTQYICRADIVPLTKWNYDHYSAPLYGYAIVAHFTLILRSYFSAHNMITILDGWDCEERLKTGQTRLFLDLSINIDFTSQSKWLKMLILYHTRLKNWWWSMVFCQHLPQPHPWPLGGWMMRLFSTTSTLVCTWTISWTGQRTLRSHAKEVKVGCISNVDSYLYHVVRCWSPNLQCCRWTEKPF